MHVFAPLGYQGSGPFVPPVPAVGVYEYGLNNAGVGYSLGSISGPRTQIMDAEGLAIDSKGRLYVADGFDNAVLIFGTGSVGNVAPIASIAGPHTGFNDITHLAIDADGFLYVADFNQVGNGPWQWNILVFSPNARGDVAPVSVLPGSPNNSSSFAVAPPVVPGVAGRYR
jgi:hypothetical protein